MKLLLLIACATVIATAWTFILGVGALNAIRAWRELHQGNRRAGRTGRLLAINGQIDSDDFRRVAFHPTALAPFFGSGDAPSAVNRPPPFNPRESRDHAKDWAKENLKELAAWNNP